MLHLVPFVTIILTTLCSAITEVPKTPSLQPFRKAQLLFAVIHTTERSGLFVAEKSWLGFSITEITYKGSLASSSYCEKQRTKQGWVSHSQNSR